MNLMMIIACVLWVLLIAPEVHLLYKNTNQDRWFILGLIGDFGVIAFIVVELVKVLGLMK